MSNDSVDYGGLPNDDNPPEEKLTWHLDEADCFSDWTIIVKTEGSDDSGTSYHCHKNIIAGGERRLKYFETLFRSSSFSEHGNNESTLVFKETAAAAFPTLLNFVYSGTLDATTDNAVPLFFLANYFNCVALDKAVKKFMDKDLCIHPKAAVYVWHAFNYDLTKLLAVAVKNTTDFLLTRVKSSDSELMKQFNAINIHTIIRFPMKVFLKIWARIEKHVKENWNTMYSAKSRTVYYYHRAGAAYCCCNIDNGKVDSSFIDRVANSTMMPDLRSVDGSNILRCVIKYPNAGNTWELLDMEKPNWVEVSLRKRCEQAISLNWSVSPSKNTKTVDFVFNHLCHASNKKRPRISNGDDDNNDLPMKILKSCLQNTIIYKEARARRIHINDKRKIQVMKEKLERAEARLQQYESKT